MLGEAAIRTEQLTKRFKQRIAVDNLSLEVRRGEVFGFLGPNGAGKTTTIAMLLGLVKPTSGRAYVLGYDIQHEPVTALRRVGAMIESPAFYPYLSGWDNLRVLARADGLPDTRISPVLETVELASRARDRYTTYSQGMRQRLALAAALLGDPELILLDEPTNGLDPAGMVDMRHLIRSLAEQGHTIFLCSHLLHEVEQICERVAILKEGRLLAQGSVADLLQQGRGVQVRVSGDPTHALDLLRTQAWIASVEQQGDLLLVDVPSTRAADVNALLSQQHITVTEIRARESNLEQVFLEITKAESRKGESRK